MKKIAIIGTQGIPAHYGGFETLAENLVTQQHDKDIEYTVFCSSKDLTTRDTSFRHARLRYIPLHSNGMQSIIYDILSMLQCIRGYDALLILGVSGCIFAPVLRLLTRSRIVINIDGLEHRREKWGKLARWILLMSEKLAVCSADVVIADNKGISEYVSDTYHKPSSLIAYGGDHAIISLPEQRQHEILHHYGITPKGYALTICRIEPENNVSTILDAFARTGKELVIVGNFQNNDYSRSLKAQYDCTPNIHIIESCYDIEHLYALRSNAAYYIHGHSAGGTNPSLVEVMHFGIPIIAFDVNYNRYTTNNEAEYFTDGTHLQQLLSQPRRQSGDALKKYADTHYRWDIIARQYEDILTIPL